MAIENYSSPEEPEQNSSFEIPEIDFGILESISGVMSEGEKIHFPVGELKPGEISMTDERLFTGTFEANGKTYKKYELHIYEGEVIHGEHPDTGQHQEIEDIFRKFTEKSPKAQKIANSPDLNEKYSDMLDEIRELSEVENGQFKVLDEQAFAKVARDPQDWGFYKDGFMVIKERKDDLKGMIQTGVHEAFHHDGKDYSIKFGLSDQTEDTMTVYRINKFIDSNIVKNDLPHSDPININTFFEESLTTHRTMEKLQANELIKPDPSAPIGIANFIDKNGDEQSMDTPQHLTPYLYSTFGLQMLDKHSPGIIKDLTESRTDPARMQDVINTINDIQPRLYERLRDMSWEEVNGTRAFEIIASALKPRLKRLD
jgi:hypothetical protein